MVDLKKIILDGSHSNHLAVSSMNMKLWLFGLLTLLFITIYKSKHLNNRVEQSHRWVKQKTTQALGWKSIEGATASLQGKEIWTMIKRGQIHSESKNAFTTFYELAK